MQLASLYHYWAVKRTLYVIYQNGTKFSQVLTQAARSRKTCGTCLGRGEAVVRSTCDSEIYTLGQTKVIQGHLNWVRNMFVQLTNLDRPCARLKQALVPLFSIHGIFSLQFGWTQDFVGNASAFSDLLAGQQTPLLTQINISDHWKANLCPCFCDSTGMDSSETGKVMQTLSVPSLQIYGYGGLSIPSGIGKLYSHEDDTEMGMF